MKSIGKYYVTSILITSLLLSTNNVTATDKFSSYEVYKQTENSSYEDKEFNTEENQPASIKSLQVDIFNESQLDILEPLATANKNLIEKDKELDETFEVSDVRETSILMVEVIELESEEQEPTVSAERLVQLDELSISQADINAMYQMVEAEGGVCNYEEKLVLANSFINKTIYQRTATKGVSIQAVLENPSQYQPVANGTYYSVTPSDEAIQAVNEALSGVDNSNGAIFFWAKYCDSSWHKSQVASGNMTYARDSSEDKHYFITFNNN